MLEVFDDWRMKVTDACHLCVRFANKFTLELGASKLSTRLTYRLFGIEWTPPIARRIFAHISNFDCREPNQSNKEPRAINGFLLSDAPQADDLWWPIDRSESLDGWFAVHVIDIATAVVVVVVVLPWHTRTWTVIIYVVNVLTHRMQILVAKRIISWHVLLVCLCMRVFRSHTCTPPHYRLSVCVHVWLCVACSCIVVFNFCI